MYINLGYLLYLWCLLLCGSPYLSLPFPLHSFLHPLNPSNPPPPHSQFLFRLVSSIQRYTRPGCISMRKCRVLPGGQGVTADIQLSIESNFPLSDSLGLNQSCLLCLFWFALSLCSRPPLFLWFALICPLCRYHPLPLLQLTQTALSVGRQQSSNPPAITPGHMTSVTIRQCLTALGVLIYLISNQLACYNWMQLPFTERERGGQLVEVINPG